METTINTSFEKLLTTQNPEEWKLVFQEAMTNMNSLNEQINLLTYDQYTEGKQSDQLPELKAKVFRLISDEKLLTTLQTWKERLSDEPLWTRRLTVMIEKVQEEIINGNPQLQALIDDLQQSYIQQTFTYKDKTYNFGTLNAAHTEENDPITRAYLQNELTKEFVQQMTPKARQLIKLRNELAQKYGYENYHDFKFQSNGLDFNKFKSEGLQLIEKTAEISREWEERIKQKLGWESIKSSDWLYLGINFYKMDSEQFPVDKLEGALKDFMNGYGIHLSSLPIDLKLKEIPFGGFCVAINPNDVRIVLNKRSGHLIYSTLFHEFGHALYNAFSSSEHPELWYHKNTVAHESMAELFQLTSYQKEWLTEYVKLDKESVSKLKDAEQLNSLIFFKYHFALSLIEQQVYANPKADYQEIANNVFKEVFNTNDQAPNPISSLVYISHPGYIQHYIFAQCIRDMIRHKFGIEGMYGEKAVFETIKQDFLEPSERYTWHEKVKKICGEPFTMKYFAEKLLN